MFPFSISYEPLAGVADMSHLLDAPAGRYGRVRVADGHFVTDKGRIRFNAVNLTGPANFPSHCSSLVHFSLSSKSSVVFSSLATDLSANSARVSASLSLSVRIFISSSYLSSF